MTLLWTLLKIVTCELQQIALIVIGKIPQNFHNMISSDNYLLSLPD